MSLIKVSNLKKYFVDRLILNIDNLEIQNGDKVGLVGANGCGKTTLLNILCGRESYDEGQIYMKSSFSYINQFDEEVGISSSRLSKELNLPSCYNDYLSGGEKVKARISKALEENTRLIIADEPTSNLDVKSIKYLEEKFKVFRGTLLLVSHDREFLDSICNKIIEIDHGQIREYKGNYSNYLKLKEESFKRHEFEYNQYISEKNKIEEAICAKSKLRDGMKKTPSRFGNSEARLHKMGNQSAKKNMDNAIKALKSRIDRLHVVDKPKENQVIKIDIAKGSEFFSNHPIEIKDLTLGFKDNILLDNVSFRLKKNKKVALIGDNGSGKTTFIEEIMKNGENIKISNRVRIGYFNQNLRILNEEKTILDNIKEESSFDETFIRIVLARFLFRREDVYKKVGILSGGEKVRVALSMVILSDNNLLILDEPTNYLDIPSMEALEEAISYTNKTMIIVSHDRRFISKVCDEVLIIKDKRLIHYPYSYEEWINKSKEVKISKDKREKEERLMIIRNKITEIISLMSIEKDEAKISKYEKSYEELLRELKTLQS